MSEKGKVNKRPYSVSPLQRLRGVGVARDDVRGHGHFERSLEYSAVTETERYAAIPSITPVYLLLMKAYKKLVYGPLLYLVNKLISW